MTIAPRLRSPHHALDYAAYIAANGPDRSREMMLAIVHVVRQAIAANAA